MHSYLIRHCPAFTDRVGSYPETWALVLKCSRGMSWGGGEYPTREAAVAQGEFRTRRRTA